jgi:23S rRNA (adenine2030-N6)-methyltransferase
MFAVIASHPYARHIRTDEFCRAIVILHTPFPEDPSVLSYRHGFHAGNFADLLKHFVQVEILNYLAQKEKPYDYIDTHAGAGMYRLDDTAAKKTLEYQTGIGHFRPQPTHTVAALEPYLSVVDQFNKPGQLKLYPGSPVIASSLMRPYDKAWLHELHSSDFQRLETQFSGQRAIKVRQQDGFQALSALLPTQSRRALVLIDPSYEVKEDYRRVVSAIKMAHKRMPTAIIALWYPVVDRRRVDDIHRHFKHSGIRNIDLFELGTQADSPGLGMTSSGMLVINPPWTLMKTMQTALPSLASIVSQDNQPHYRCDTLVPE